MFKRVLLKLSGEALAGEKKTGIDPDTVDKICDQIVALVKQGVQVGVVTGGGNFWRGRTTENMDRTTSDYMGMLGTIMNSLCVKDCLIHKGISATCQTSIAMNQVAEHFTQRDAVRRLDAGEVVVFGGGTGSPFFSTDTTAALRACEIGADTILVAKTIDGVYSADPKLDPNAVKYDEISYSDVLTQNLKVMDAAAIAMCRDNNISLVVFGLDDPENIVRAANGEKIGTIVK